MSGGPRKGETHACTFCLLKKIMQVYFGDYLDELAVESVLHEQFYVFHNFVSNAMDEKLYCLDLISKVAVIIFYGHTKGMRPGKFGIILTFSYFLTFS